MQFGQTFYVMPPAFSKFRKLFNKRRHCFFSLPLRYVVAESDFLAAVGKAYTSRYARPSRARGLHKMRLGNFGHEILPSGGDSEEDAAVHKSWPSEVQLLPAKEIPK